jgi:hypothetical protein
MADEGKAKMEKNKLKNNELSDEQLNEASGGKSSPKIVQKCFLCGDMSLFEDLILVKVNGVMCRVCSCCADDLKRSENV